MLSFKNSLTLFFAVVLIFSLQAKESSVIVGQAPPYSIDLGDTSTSMLPKLKNDVRSNSKFESVQDTLMPPCDVLFFKSGKLEYCKIVEATPTTITYKMCDYLDGPNIIINKSDIHKIRYANGKEELVAAEKQTKNAYVKPRKDPLATLSFIFALTGVAIIIVFHAIIPALALAGLTLGVISFFKIRRKHGELRGTGSAILGILLSVLILILLAIQ